MLLFEKCIYKIIVVKITSNNNAAIKSIKTKRTRNLKKTFH
ncbi:MAG: hypothetical protein RI980_390 [Bacteroidota bacterium]|jgi:hypothetical protein